MPLSSKKPVRVSAEPETTTDLELTVLRALCTQPGGQAARAKLANELKEYRWEHGDHRVIYEALIKIASPDPQTLRQQLPAVTVRMGFPDIDWQQYFAPAPIPTDRLYDLIRDLKSRAKTAAFGNAGPTA
jgi:hypothetical protein